MSTFSRDHARPSLSCSSPPCSFFSSCQGRFSLMILSWSRDWSSYGLPKPDRFRRVHSCQWADAEVLLLGNRAVKCDVMSLDKTVATIVLVPLLLRLEPLLVVLTHGWRVWSSFLVSFVQHRNYIFPRRHER